MLFPEYLEPFRKEAEKLFLKKKDLEVIFSGPTYQVRVEKGTWVFVQLDGQAHVKDIFCQCDVCQESGACTDMALALIAIGEDIPLHTRFEKSPFFAAFSPLTHQKFSREITKEKHSLSLGNIVTITGPEIWIKEIFHELLPKEETEETSIKFSDLSEEEINDWRKGVFSKRLKFELSPYADIAKKLFLLSLKEPCSYTINVEKEPSLLIRWKHHSASLPIISATDFNQILETLPPKKTTPPLHPYGGLTIQRFFYDRVAEKCVVQFSGKKYAPGKLIGKGPWSFSAKDGFIKKQAPQSLTLSDPQDIAAFLSHNLSVDPLPIQYSIEVGNGLTLTPFLKKPHDLDNAIFFDSWIWTEAYEFQKVSPLRWPAKKISSAEVEEFVTHNRHFLSQLSGFSVHEYPAKHSISFHIDATGALFFSTHISHTDNKKEISFGKWTYIKGEGFFLKENATPFPLSPIPPHRVAEFIRKNIDQLKELPGFFSDAVPIHGVSLEITYTKKKQIELIPRYTWEKAEYEKNAFFYDDFCYVTGLGFFIMPPLLTQPHLARTIFPSDKEAWEKFLLEELPILKQEFPCVVDHRLEAPKNLSLVCDSLATEDFAQKIRLPHLWEATFFWQSEKGTVSSHELLAACVKKQRLYPSEAGLIDLLDNRFGWLSSAPLLKSTLTHKLATTDLLKIHAHEEFFLTEGISSQTKNLIQRLLATAPQTPPLLDSFQSDLRSYQKRGVEWLWYLYTNGLSGLLCDDMGVGKTHQAMALLSSVDEAAQKEGKKPSFLILCPTSLFWHWKDRIEGSLPHLSIFPYVGGNRYDLSFQGDERIFLTTYGIWRNEVTSLKKIPFEVAIFDELQIAKNNVSRIWSALSQVKASMRLGLTGTPIENNVSELKALFDILLPGYLPHTSLQSAIGKKSTKKNLLSRYARPFILRRRKQDVLLDLPQKTEEIFTIELTGEQKTLYKQIAARQSAHIVQQLHDEYTPIPYMHIFALLSALKQICNHPAAYLHDVENYTRYDSGKWDAFTELLEEAQESGQKVIVFSHYLAMLDIIALHLKSKNIHFSEIRGSTKHRGAAVERFQKDPHCTVFLGSLQAAGLGIDLTAGSVVIHYDRWWNAARENQATDRAHRIGQTRGVMVYKLLTTGTVEERIDELITQKAQLFEDIIKFDDHRIMKHFNRQDLIALLSDIDQV